MCLPSEHKDSQGHDRPTSCAVGANAMGAGRQLQPSAEPRWFNIATTTMDCYAHLVGGRPNGRSVVADTCGPAARRTVHARSVKPHRFAQFDVSDNQSAAIVFWLWIRTRAARVASRFRIVSFWFIRPTERLAKDGHTTK